MRTVLGCLAVVIGSALAIASPSIGHSPVSVERGVQHRYAAVAFDYFVLFNPDSVVVTVDRIAPGKGREFTNLWRTRQFEYSWLRSINGRYVDFGVITSDALAYTAHALHLELTAAQRHQLLDAYLHLTPWPDTAVALHRLREAHVRVITIANFTPTMLRANAEHVGLAPLFDASARTRITRISRIHARISWGSIASGFKSATSSLPRLVDGMQLARSRSGIQPSG